MMLRLLIAAAILQLPITTIAPVAHADPVYECRGGRLGGQRLGNYGYEIQIKPGATCRWRLRAQSGLRMDKIEVVRRPGSGRIVSTNRGGFVYKAGSSGFDAFAVVFSGWDNRLRRNGSMLINFQVRAQ